MRNETEFKAEVLARFEVKKKERKKRRRILAAALPVLIVTIAVSIVFLSQGFIPLTNNEASDGAAFRDSEAAEGAVGSPKPDIFDTETVGDNATSSLPHDTVQDGCGNTAASESDVFNRIYTDKEKIDKFKSLLGEFETSESTKEHLSSATGSTVTLLSGDVAEKYIIVYGAVFTADMKMLSPIDEYEFYLINQYLKTTPSDNFTTSKE